MYVKLDSSLEPRRIKDINDTSGGRSRKVIRPEYEAEGGMELGFEYEVKTGKAGDFFCQAQSEKVVGIKDTKLNEMQLKKWNEEADIWMGEELDNIQEQLEKDNPIPDLESVLGTRMQMCYDHDWGFFSTILACYNNHWTLKTSPDDWWNVIVKNISQAVDDHGDKQKVRDFFVSHEGQKKIHIKVPSLKGLEYDWLFDIFSVEVRKNIKIPGYVDLMEANFSTTTPEKMISTQIMLMSSVQKYFRFSLSTSCGIPGIEMIGTENDWEQLIEKMTKLEKTLESILEVIELTTWFNTTKDMLSKLLDTYRNSPDTNWWGHILTWNERHGSGKVNSWDGWIIDFIMAGKAETPHNFRSGVVSLPFVITEAAQGPPVTDTGHLVAGTLGFTIQEGTHDKSPCVEAVQGWALLMPKGSKVTPRLLATYKSMPQRFTAELQSHGISDEIQPRKLTTKLEPHNSTAESQLKKSTAESHHKKSTGELEPDQRFGDEFQPKKCKGKLMAMAKKVMCKKKKKNFPNPAW